MERKAVDNGDRGVMPDWERLAQTNRKIFYGLNLLFLLPSLRKIESFIVGAAVGVLLLVLLDVSTRAGKGSEPASAQVTLLIFFDGLIWLALHHEALLMDFYPDFLDRMVLTYMQRPICIVLIVIGVVLGLVGLQRRSFWLVSFSGVTLGAAIILSFWSSGSLRNFQLLTNGEKVLKAFMLCAFIWTLFSRIVLYAEPKRWGLNIFLSILLLCGIAALHLLDPLYVRFLATELTDIFLSWGQISFVCVVLLGAAIAMANNGTGRANFDSLMLLSCAIFIFGAKYISHTYFMCRWLLFLLLVASMIWCLKNTAEDSTTLGFRPLIYMILQTAVFFFMAKALQMGLYANVILAVVTGLALLEQRKQKKPELFQDFFCGILIAFFAAEALAWQWRLRFSREGVILIAVVFIMAMGALLLVGLPHPEGVRAPKSVRIWICACSGILCLLSMIPTLWIQSEVLGSESCIEVKALGGAVVTEVSYCWKNWNGQVLEEAGLKGDKAILSNKGNILTVTAVDERGIRSSRDFWYPVQFQLF